MTPGNQARVKKIDKFESKGMIIFIYPGDPLKFPPERAMENNTIISVNNTYIDCGVSFMRFDVTVVLDAR